ncbi:addiction module antidote protein [Pseudomonas granadensis]|uniref:addiction module antidote protein n=1 Tax=Pseudomonas granadensis TaxID=1421430 RepID=UPI000B7C9F58
MNDTKFNAEDMPILDLDASKTGRYEASRFLDTPEVISAYLSESMRAQDPHLLMQALAEVAKARGVNKVAEDAGINRESLYKSFKGGAHTRFETINRLMRALGVELTVQPIPTNSAAPSIPSAEPAMASPRSPAIKKADTAKRPRKTASIAEVKTGARAIKSKDRAAMA